MLKRVCSCINFAKIKRVQFRFEDAEVERERSIVNKLLGFWLSMGNKEESKGSRIKLIYIYIYIYINDDVENCDYSMAKVATLEL